MKTKLTADETQIFSKYDKRHGRFNLYRQIRKADRLDCEAPGLRCE